MKSKTIFEDLVIAENGIILSYKSKQQQAVSFSELDTIYLKRYQLNPFFEFFIISLPFLLIPTFFTYLSFNLASFLALVTIFPVFVTIKTYRWYRLKIYLKDGRIFQKKVPLKSKIENISLVNRVQTEKLYYKARMNGSALCSIKQSNGKNKSLAIKLIENQELETQLEGINTLFA